MLQRNFLLLIIVLFIILLGFLGWAYLFQPNSDNTDGGGEVINFIADFLPFMGDKVEPVIDDGTIDLSGFDTEPEIETNNGVLVKVSSFPVSGFGVFDKENITTETNAEGETTTITENNPYIKYAEKSNGNIYQTSIANMAEVRTTTTVVPLIYESTLAGNGEFVAMRYLNAGSGSIETFLGEIAEGDRELKGAFLPANIVDISVSGDQSKIFYLLDTGEESIGTVLNLLNGSKTQVFDSSFTDWVSSWGSSKLITLTTRASAGSPGYVYGVNPDTKSFNKIFGGMNGLTTLASPTGTKILYADNTLALYVFDISTGESKSVGVRTLPEKCVWRGDGETLYCAVPKVAPGLSYPDLWYRGEFSFSDELWRINTTTNATTKLIDLSLGGESIDAIKPALSSDENYLVFMNKIDSFVWRMELN